MAKNTATKTEKEKKPKFDPKTVSGWSADNWESYFKGYMKCDFPHIRYYVENKQGEYVETLKKDILDGKGFAEVKENFYKKYFPTLIPTPQMGDGMLDWADPEASRAKKKEQQKKARERAKEKKAAEKAKEEAENA